MFVLNRPARMIGAGIGFVKEYNADRKAKQVTQNQHPTDASKQQNEHASDTEKVSDSYYDDTDSVSEDGEHEWAQAIDEAQFPRRPQDFTKLPENVTETDLVESFLKRHPPPPYTQQQPSGQLAMPVIVPQRRPAERTQGWVRGYAPVLADVGVTQDAWFEFLDSFDKSLSLNNVFWAANLAVMLLDHAYVLTTGNIWVQPIVIAIHLSIEGARRGYMHHQQNHILDQMNDKYFKPRGLFAMVVKYKPESMDEVGEWTDVRQNLTESVTKRDDAHRGTWDNITEGGTGETTDRQMPEFAPLIFPFFDENDTEQNESAWQHFNRFRQEYADRGVSAQFQAQNPESRLGGVAPQEEYHSRYANPNHPARQGFVGLIGGGKVNPQRGLLRHRRRRARKEEQELAANVLTTRNEQRLNSSNVAPDGVDRNQVARQAMRQRRPRGMRRVFRQDVLYLMVVNMPSEDEMREARTKLGLST